MRAWRRGAARIGATCLVVAALAVPVTVLAPTAGALVDARVYGESGPLSLRHPIVGIAATRTGQGYWRVASDGGIFTAGDAKFYGSTGALPLKRPIVGIAPTPTNAGYWLVASDGGVFSFGDATFYGSTGAMRLNRPIVGMAPTKSGRGYWLVASDGGIFSFGDATFHGSTGHLSLVRPVVGMARTPSGKGYWMVASDGGIFSFGDATFHGSTGNIRLAQPIVGMSPTSTGDGYWMVASDGGIFNFGKATFYGSAASACPDAGVVGMASSSAAKGYWIALANARTFAFSPTSKPSACSTTDRAARDFFGRINDERAARGLPALTWDTTLASWGRDWSREMARTGFRHSDLGALLRATGGTYGMLAENIAMGSRGVSAGDLHGALMRSDGHRTNILGAGLQTVGIGVYCGADGSIWATQVFGRLSSSGPGPALTTPPRDPITRTDSGTSRCG